MQNLSEMSAGYMGAEDYRKTHVYQADVREKVNGAV